MTRPNLVNVKTLCWIARLGTFGEAAARMSTSQPAISARMRELQLTLGFSLFERNGRQLQLTPRARSFVTRVEPIIGALDAVFSEGDTTASHVGTVRIGLGEISMTWFAGTIPQLRKVMPRVSFELELHLAADLRRMMEKGKLDIAIIAGGLNDPRYTSEVIGHTRMMWLASSSLLHDEIGRQKSHYELLKTTALWCVARPSDFFPSAQHTLREAGANLENICTCNRLGALIDVVERGGGIGHIPEIMVADRIADGRMVSIEPELVPTRFEFTMSCLRNHNRPVIQHIMKTALDMSMISGLRPETSPLRKTRPKFRL